MLTMQSVAALENVSVNVIITDLTHRVGEIVQFIDLPPRYRLVAS